MKPTNKAKLDQIRKQLPDLPKEADLYNQLDHQTRQLYRQRYEARGPVAKRLSAALTVRYPYALQNRAGKKAIVQMLAPVMREAEYIKDNNKIVDIV